MALTPIKSNGLFSSSMSRTLTQSRTTLDELRLQLATGKKADSYGGLGNGRGVALSVRASLTALDGYRENATNAGLRLDMMLQNINSLVTLGSETRGDLDPAGYLLERGRTTAQIAGQGRLEAAIDALNVNYGGRYLFSGRDVNTKPVVTSSEMLNGSGSQAGLMQHMVERRQADQGLDGRGRLLEPVATADTVTLGEEFDGNAFGFKLRSIGTSIAGATTSGPAGSPPEVSITLTGQPERYDVVRVTLELPDGTTEEIQLTAVTEAPYDTYQFRIGNNLAATVANIRTALDGAVQHQANTSLVAASAMRAGEDFFNIDADHPPQRVQLPAPPNDNFGSATSLRDGTPEDTVFWYKGDMGMDNARDTSVARIDSSITVSMGARANEAGLRETVQGIAVFAAIRFDPDDPEGGLQYRELLPRLRQSFGGESGLGPLQGMATEIATTRGQVQASGQRHRDTEQVLTGVQAEVEGVSVEETALSLLALQTRLQASYSVTAMVQQLSLVNFL